MAANPLIVSAKQYNTIYNSKSDGSEVGISTQDMFNFQIRSLKTNRFDFSDEEVERLRPFVPKQSLQFLLVPSRPNALDLNSLTARIKTDGSKLGECELISQKMVDIIPRPSTAHMLWGIEDGRERLDIEARISIKRIKREKRIAYTAWYGLIHAIVFPYILRHHCLDLCGSLYNKIGLPALWLGGCNNTPKLFSNFFPQNTFPNWGAPSAKDILGA